MNTWHNHRAEHDLTFLMIRHVIQGPLDAVLTTPQVSHSRDKGWHKLQNQMLG